MENNNLKKFKLMFRDSEHRSGEWYCLKTVKCTSEERAWELLANVFDEIVENVRECADLYDVIEIKSE